MSGARVSAPKHAPGAARTPFFLLVLGLIGGGMCALLALNTASAANELRRHDLAVKDASIANTLVQLHNDVAQSSAPQNLASAARELGMVPAGNPAFLVMGSGTSVRLLGSPAAATGAPAYVPPSSSTARSSSASASGSGAASSSGAAKSGSAKSSSSPTHPSSTPTPTPTPTPNTTLPGGHR
jgi:hypothetical protein